MFAITTSRHMLLNPYPHEEQGSRCMSVIVARTAQGKTGAASRDIYSQYLECHFTRTWTAPTTRGVDDPPPLVSRISLSGDATDTNSLLIREITESAPQDADLIEYSGDTVRPLLERLATAGTQVRLLLKHPDSVRNAQRDKILATYRYIKEYQFKNNPDSIQIRFYKMPAALRGRRLGTRLLNVGWYTPDIATGVQTPTIRPGQPTPMDKATLHENRRKPAGPTKPIGPHTAGAPGVNRLLAVSPAKVPGDRVTGSLAPSHPA